MKQKAFVLQNKGMNRDLSISKAGESSAYENHNIRIEARGHDTFLSVTNERGNKRVVLEGLNSDNLRISEDEELRVLENRYFRTVDDPSLSLDGDFIGDLIGWNVLNNHIVLFTHAVTDGEKKDYIFRVDYENNNFYSVLLFSGDLGFDVAHPIESVVYHETDEIQKIYWVDGINPLRFMNFMAKPEEMQSWDVTSFDSNRAVNFGVEVSISKDNSGNTRANGVVQYLLTYYNKHGQESGYVWISDLVYLSPVSSGGAADGTNNNSVTLNISNLDKRFTHFRVYSVFRSSLNGTTMAYIVFDGTTDDGNAVVVDNNSHLVSVDPTSLLYLGSQHVIAGTLTHKDQTLFLGDLSSVDRDYDYVEEVLRQYMLVHNQNGPDWESAKIEFVYDDEDIPNETSDGNYAYNSQLTYTSSQITSFKGGEKYRFGIAFHKKDGTMTDTFWIGDKVNHLYPKMSDTGITRIIAKCVLPPEVVTMMKEKGYSTAQLMIAEATYADRSIKAQGIVCPTMFNVWNRYMDRLYASASWMMRPRNSEYAWRHFDVVDNATNSTGEIDCNYWETETTPKPYYRLKDYAGSKSYDDEFDGLNEYDYALIVYRIWCRTYPAPNAYYVGATVILAKALEGNFSSTYEFNDRVLYSLNSLITNNDEQRIIYTDASAKMRISVHNLKSWLSESPFDVNKGKEYAHSHIITEIHKNYQFFSENELVDLQTFRNLWCNVASDDGNENKWWFFNNSLSGKSYTSIENAVNDDGAKSSGRWYPLGEEGAFGDGDDYAPAYYKKHLMFVDENVITLNSPEIEYEAISFDKVDKYGFRIVGIAKIDSNYSDYTVDATHAKYVGESLVREKLTNTLIAWPLWKEHTLNEKLFEDDDSTKERTEQMEDDPRFRDSDDYIFGGGYARYWLRMWNHPGVITGFTDKDNNDYSRLLHKTFANARYSKKTQYDVRYENGFWSCEPNSIRIFNYLSSQYVGINIDNDTKYYDAVLNEFLSVPGEHKYPVLYTPGIPDPSKKLVITEDADLYLSDPVALTYASTPHAVISLPTKLVPDGGRIYYNQTILPKMSSRESIGINTASGSDTGALLPWIDNTADTSYPYKDYTFNQDLLTPPNGFDPTSKYVYIGEIYSNLEDSDQIRYGGVSDAAIQNNRFLIAGPQYIIADMNGDGDDVMVANQADTYIQRWDCLKTKPYSTGALNNVIDITSVMLETHINIDGRTDLQRGTSYIASLDTAKFGSLNHVYSQGNNFIVGRDLDEDFNLDSYRSSITWTMEKHDSEDVDEWTHITLASTLKLDGDKGICRALRRMQNSIIAFQDRGISEILFNSRTQLTTQDGVPVEIANSGKVDGKRYITNKYGCVNKWSIIEGKAALYFVDNINKAFCAFSGEGIENVSTKLGFSNWFRQINNTEPWNPDTFDNLVSYYDRIHSDVYLVKKDDEDGTGSLVYNEVLGVFTSFFDYHHIPMMANVEDRFLSYNNHSLWLQNEGLYCNFFGNQYDYWTWYRVTPEPYSDKIWTNIDYRADFFEVLDESGDATVSEADLINGDVEDSYKEWETFSEYRVWNEYQSTGFVPFAHDHFDRDDVRKKFRIWRLTIPRALRNLQNKHGLDRIRNPWVNLLFQKNDVDGKYLMQLHDIVVKYFE